MAKDLKSHIEDTIKKTGFITEIDAVEVFESENWHLLAPHYYYDRDENKWRDMDMIASRLKILPFDELILHFNLQLVIECKKSDKKAWVFLARPTETEDKLRKIYDIDYLDHASIAIFLSPTSRKLPLGTLNYSQQVITHSRRIAKLNPLVITTTTGKLADLHELGLVTRDKFQYFKNSRIGLYWEEINKSSNNKSGRMQIFDALMKVNKGLTFIAESSAMIQYNTLKNQANKDIRIFEIDVIIPLIIFEGDLFIYEKASGANKIDILNVRSFNISSGYSWRRLVTIIRKKYLKKFLRNLDKDIAKITKLLHENHKTIKKHVKSLSNAQIDKTIVEGLKAIK